MAKKQSKDSNYNSSRGRHKSGSGKSNKGLVWVLIAVSAFAIGSGIIWWCTRSTPDAIDGSKVAEFAKSQIQLGNNMPDEIDAYIDFSDGMQWAYNNNEVTKSNLKAIVNKLVMTSEFYSMADGAIDSMGKQNQTTIYNQIIDEQSYVNKKSAPIEATLQQIIKNRRPAFVMTDFEEYKGGRIQQVGYAKKYFTDWINMGNDITFYVMDYEEGCQKPIKKHLYFTVFDGGEHKLVKAIDEALKDRSQQPTKFVLSNNKFTLAHNYDKNAKGGNYHDANGKDIVTVIDESGSADSYQVIDGYFAEYYPLNGGTWANILENAKALSPEALNGVNGAVPFEHVIADRYVNLEQNHGFKVKKLDIKVTDETGLFRKKFEEGYDGPDDPIEIPDFLKLANSDVTNSDEHEIAIIFDPKFNGTFPPAIDPNGLFRVDVTVGETIENLEKLDSLFKWDGNDSLLESVRNTLQATNPKGTRLMTFYIHLRK